MKNSIYKILAITLGLSTLATYLIFMKIVISESDKLDHIYKVAIPSIAEKSYVTGCIKLASQAKSCREKAKLYKNEMIKTLALDVN